MSPTGPPPERPGSPNPRRRPPQRPQPSRSGEGPGGAPPGQQGQQARPWQRRGKRLTDDPVAMAAVGVALALALAVVAFALTRAVLAPDPVATVVEDPGPTTVPLPTAQTTQPSPSPAGSDLPPTATTPDPVITPTPPPTRATTPAPPPPAPPPPPPPTATTPAQPIRLIEGNPAGSGCTPGPGALPDGQWIGYLTEAGSPGEVDVDLVCYDSSTGTATNSNDLVRTVPIARDADVACADGPCDVTAVPPGALTVLAVEEGRVVALQVLR